MKLTITAVLLVLSFGVARAGKYNLTSTLKSSLIASHVPPTETCIAPGICVPVNQTIPGQSLWYWCGFYTTHKTIYNVTSNHATNNFSGSWLIRKTVLMNCALGDLGAVENCPVIPETSCSSKKSCLVRAFGLAFGDEMCLMVINNKASAIIATVQVNNWYSVSRYHGTVFTVVLAVLVLLGVLGNVSYQMYVRMVSPVGKPRPHVKREDELTVVSSFAEGDDLKAVPVHKSSWYNRLVHSFRSKSSKADKDTEP